MFIQTRFAVMASRPGRPIARARTIFAGPRKLDPSPLTLQPQRSQSSLTIAGRRRVASCDQMSEQPAESNQLRRIVRAADATPPTHRGTPGRIGRPSTW